MLALFPGVPVFFLISGLLISRSYETNRNLREYAVNRSLRIFPGLVVCVALNLLAVASTGYFGQVSARALDVALLGTPVMMHFPSDTAFALRAPGRNFFGALAPASSTMARSTFRAGSRTCSSTTSSGRRRPARLGSPDFFAVARWIGHSPLTSRRAIRTTAFFSRTA